MALTSSATTTSSATAQAPTGTNPIPRLTALMPQNQPESPLLRGNQDWDFVAAYREGNLFLDKVRHEGKTDTFVILA